PVRAQSKPALSFDVVSMKPANPTSPPLSNSAPERFPVCGGYRMQTDPAQFRATNTTVYKLITWAFGIRYRCYIVNDAGLLSGGPKWVLTERFDIQATIPAGAPQYTVQQLQDGAAPELQVMLRTLLAERFKVSVHRASKETQVYELTVAPGGP